MILGPPDHIDRLSREPGRDDVDLAGYTELLRRYRMLFALALAVALAAGAGVYYSSEPEYTAQTELVVVTLSDLAAEEVRRPADVSIDSAVQVLLSDKVLGETARTLDYPGRSAGLLEDLTVSPLINSRILRIYVSASSALEARDAVQLLSQNFLAARKQSLDSVQRTTTESVTAQLAAVEANLALRERGDDAAAVVAAQDVTDLQAARYNLSTELTALALGEPEPGYISRHAELPSTGARTGTAIYLGSALALGLAGASAITAFLVLRPAGPSTRRIRSSPGHSARPRILSPYAPPSRGN
ncbi:capsular polysaccharide biosynthesis protein [Arthrobacter sp. CAN_A6]|uniref:Wzz/FepE/Etk N-terminal domain-containing protein n=1 Tax=Arthrobacter sp. CAN_A6 TaxID=2787721 RepID=UPI0018CBDCFC